MRDSEYSLWSGRRICLDKILFHTESSCYQVNFSRLAADPYLNDSSVVNQLEAWLLVESQSKISLKYTQHINIQRELRFLFVVATLGEQQYSSLTSPIKQAFQLLNLPSSQARKYGGIFSSATTYDNLFTTLMIFSIITQICPQSPKKSFLIVSCL